MKNFLIFFLLILLVVFRYFSTRPNYKVGDRVVVSTKVLSEPTVYETSQGLSLLGLMVYLPKYPEVGYGDYVLIEGEVAKSKNGKYLKLINPKLKKLERNRGILITFRQKLLGFYQRSLPDPHSSLIAGMVLGSKANIPADFWEDLKSSGTAHVVVASGMNVTLVAGFVMGILILFLPRLKAAVISIITIWLYAFIAGFGAPIVRAALMGSIMFLSQIFGKVAIGMRVLVISAFLMLLIKPDYLTDIGFWLSFASSASLIAFGRTFERILKKTPAIFREGLSTSLAAQIGVAPILYYAFGYINILSPLINALVLWTVSLITVIGMFAGLAGIEFEPLGKVILYLDYPLTYWFILIVSRFSN